MLGPPKSRCLDEPIAVSLEALVPPDHFYRHLEPKLDLGFGRQWVRELYAERGRPSIDPVVFFKQQLVMFFEGIRSERKLIETASLNLAHRWYLGSALDEDFPDHSSLTRIRQRLGVDIFQRFFETVVDLCQEARLVRGKELYVDATVAGLLPVQAAATAGHRGHDLRHGREHRCRRGRGDPGVLAATRSGPYQKALGTRQVWVEPLFAEAKVWHGLRRFRLRGLENVNIEGLLIAAGQNLKRFLAATGWGRRPAPCGRLAAVPTEPWGLVAAFT